MRPLLALVTIVLMTWSLAPAVAVAATAEHAQAAPDSATHAEHSGSASATAADHAAEAHAPAVDQAVLPPAGIRWPFAMVTIVIGLFIAAAVIGPISRLEEPEPVAHSHDDDHSHGHGHTAGGHH